MSLVVGNDVPHITQIAAYDLKSDKKFSVYVTPKKDISMEATMVTGLSISSNGTLLHNGKEVQAQLCKPALQSFLTWLSGLGDRIILAAHNCRNFDAKVLTTALECTGLIDTFTETVCAFSDTLKVLRKKLPERTCHKQEDLVHDILRKNYEAHNAEGDVAALAELLVHLKVTPSELVKMTFPSEECHLQNIFLQEKAKNIASYHPLIAKGIMKTSLAENVAGSGLSVAHLRLIYKRNSNDGLLFAFTGKNSKGRPRVTDHKKTVEKVLPALAEHFDSEK